MSYDRLIHDYLDSGLDQTGEEALFAHLSNNADMRAEFNRQIKLQNLAGLDMRKITVPSELTGAVFTQLGFAAPGSSVFSDAGSIHGKNSALMDITRKYSGLIFLLLLAFTAGSSLYLLNENSNLKNTLISTAEKQKKIPVMTSSAEIPKSNFTEPDANQNYSGQDNSNSGSAGNFKQNNNPVRNVNYNKSLSSNGDYYVTDNASVQENLSDVAAQNSSADYAANNTENQNIRLINSVPHFSGNSESLMMNLSHNEKRFAKSGRHLKISDGQIAYNSEILYDMNMAKWSIQLRRINNMSNSPAITVSDESNFFTDNTIAVWYNVSQDWSVGLESGSEIFPMQFKEGNSNIIQAPMRQWTGLSLKYNPKEILLPYTLNPYLLQTAGFTSMGPVFKTQTGLAYSFLNQFTLFAGMEYGVLIYNVGGNLYNTGKIGWTGGVSINLR